ncbi:MAG: polyhydroxyalkanoic acid system family protein [Gemmatimonadaceae bacterium]|nr:polyhydroxyalkanoic acid system family protein [Gemmatimonadaceae bacterium]MDQ3520695.1 polyhydroxyalkanoic acid system family protein [Gemmatimonadota bacterium]
MPRYRTEISHELGRREALDRLRAKIEWASTVSNLKAAWSENTCAFAVSIQGVAITGDVHVEDNALKVECQLPLVALPFRSWLPRMMRKALEQPSPVELASESGGATTTAPANQPPTVLFLHIPKAGGTTLGEFIYNQCSSSTNGGEPVGDAGVLFLSYGFIREPDTSAPEYIRPSLRRPDLRAVIGHFSYGIHEFVEGPSIYVTLLRNPVDRVLSLYHFLEAERQTSIEEFVAHPSIKEVDNDQTRRIAGVDPAVGGCTNAMLLKAMENMRRHFAVAGVIERLDETLILLRRKLAWTREVISYPRNVNSSKPPVSLLSQDVVEAILNRNELDAKLHQYAGVLMDEAIAKAGSEFQDELLRYRAVSRTSRDSNEAVPGSV